MIEMIGPMRWKGSSGIPCLNAGVLIVTLILGLSSDLQGQPAEGYRTGRALEQQLQQWTSLSVLEGEQSLLEFCERLSATHRIAIWLDRRINFHQPIRLREPVTGSLEQILTRLAERHGLEGKEIGDAWVLIPARKAGSVRTLIAMREQEAKLQMGHGAPSQKKHWRDLFEEKSFSWSRLSQPRELAIEFCRRNDLTILNSDAIPHDLWRAGELPEANAVEVLSFLLFQYDQTFSWQSDQTIRIEPIQRPVAIEKSHRLTSTDEKQLRERFARRFPHASWDRQNSHDVVVQGPVELHDAIETWLSGETSKTPSSRIPWKDKRYTLQVKRKPLKAILAYLDQAGVPVEYDLKKLKEQGVDVDQILSFQTTKADAEGLFKAICGPAGIPYEVTEDGIRIGKKVRE